MRSRRVLPKRASEGLVAEAAHEIEEAHQHTGLTNAVSVERHASPEAEARRRFDRADDTDLTGF